MATPITGIAKSFEKPDERITKGGALIEVLRIGDMNVRRITYPPGWRFSTHMGAPKCLDTHVGYTLSGHMVAELDSGTRLEFGPGSVFVIPAGHDGWVTGDEPAVIVQFDEGESAARRFNVASPTTKAA